MRGLLRLVGEAGLSMLELVVVSVLLIVLSGILYAAFRFESLSFNRETARGVAEADLRTWMSRMVKDIRNAGYDPLTTAGAGITTATSSDFEFAVDYDNSGAITASDRREKLGYRLSGSSLQLLQGATWRTVVTGVTSLTFTYWNFQGGQVNQTSPYTSYQDIAEVRIALAAQGADASSSVTMSGRALIRNPNSW